MASAARERVGGGRFPAHISPRVRTETCVPPGFTRSHWKGNGRQEHSACPCSFPRKISTQCGCSMKC